MAEIPTIVAGCLALLAAIFVYRTTRNKRLPPGPPGSFLIGNLLQIPESEPWKWFTALAKDYGMRQRSHYLVTQSNVLRLL